MDSYWSKVNKLRRAVADRVKREDSEEVQAADSPAEPSAEAAKLRHALAQLKGRDRVGVLGEAAVVAGSTAAGAALSGVAAGAAGATTLLGSTSLAGLLGGVFVTTTPVGWVVGTAAVAGVAGYGLVKLIRTGNKQDHVRSQVSERLSVRLDACESGQRTDDEGELGNLLRLTLVAGAIAPESASKMIDLVQSGALSQELALLRLRAIAQQSGVAEQS